MVISIHLISHISVTDYCVVSAVVASRSLAVAMLAAQGASAFLYDRHTLLPDRDAHSYRYMNVCGIAIIHQLKRWLLRSGMTSPDDH